MRKAMKQAEQWLNRNYHFIRQVEANKRMLMMKLYARQQGEWISQFDYCKQHNMMPSGYGNFWWCNKCDSANEKKSNYCPNCGAYMKGGAE